MKKEDDVQLIQRTLSGDEAAFGVKEETLVQEVLGNVQIPTSIYQNIMREIPHIKPLSPIGGKPPIVPWAIATSTDLKLRQPFLA